jgi:hypothetical protein
MARQDRLKANAEKMCDAGQAAYPAWKIEATRELQRRHDIAAAAIPERVWANLFMRGLDPQATADRAEIYYRSIRPAGLLWRKAKKPQGQCTTAN